jgi:hypothetical protein
MAADTGGTAIMNSSVVRYVAIGASVVAAVLYLGIGLGLLDIGEAAEPNDPGLFEFGAMMAAVFGATAVLLWLVRSRILWIAVAVVQVIVLLGYVAAASYREPAFELWGIAIKVAQAVVLVAMVYLIAHAREATAPVPTTTQPPTAPTGHPA